MKLFERLKDYKRELIYQLGHYFLKSSYTKYQNDIGYLHRTEKTWTRLLKERNEAAKSVHVLQYKIQEMSKEINELRSEVIISQYRYTQKSKKPKILRIRRFLHGY